MAQLEYNNIPRKFLHKNKHEHTFTCGGIYLHANPDALDISFIEGVVLACKDDIKRASAMLYHDQKINKQIEVFCKNEIWDKMHLDEVSSQKIADELFLFAFHTHYRTAVKVAQRVIGVKADGFIGPVTLNALNEYDAYTFDIKYDEREDEHYKTIIERKPYLQINYRGWRKRAYEV